jgi:hypothetical protein
VAGILTIHSSGDGSLLSGHSWIEYQQDGGETHTYGTWGNNPRGLGNGLHEDLELGQTSDASRSMHISDDQEAKLYQTIDVYKSKGEGGWEYLNPCSGFASEAWEAATGETLSSRSYLIVSNPSKLKESIQEADTSDSLQDTGAADVPARPQGSSRSVTDPISRCPNSG